MSFDDQDLDRILEGDVSPDEAAEFQQWLQTPENMERYASRAELVADLRRSLTRRNIQATALASQDAVANSLDASSNSTNASFVGPSSSPSPTPWWTISLAAAATATAACLLIVISYYNQTNPTDIPDAVAASVVSNVNGLLTKDGQQWKDEGLTAGGYELQTGLLSLQFSDGVMVYIEAPARFDAVSDKRVVVHQGRLSARVPPAGVGFTVTTPTAEVIDFGTEFSMDVESGASEVHVFDGLVRVQPVTTAQDQEPSSVELRASQAVRITAGATKPVDIDIANDRFIRNFDEPKRSYVRTLKQLQPLVFYRMPIRDRGLVSEPPTHSGIVLTGAGKRPPHARGVFVGGSLRVGADSVGRGGRVDTPPQLNTGEFSLTTYVYRNEPIKRKRSDDTTTSEGTPTDRIVVTNQTGNRGNFTLSANEYGMLQATIITLDGQQLSLSSPTRLPLRTWRHVVVTVNNRQLQLYEDGQLVATLPCPGLSSSSGSDPIWFGTSPIAGKVWHGRIDEFALFDRALSNEEIATLYRAAQREIAKLP